jgi:hypothetical protein
LLTRDLTVDPSNALSFVALDSLSIRARNVPRRVVDTIEGIGKHCQRDRERDLNQLRIGVTGRPDCRKLLSTLSCRCSAG